MVNFKVVENVDRVTPLLDDFIRLYNNPLVTCAEIREQLNISYKTYKRLFDKAISDGSIEYRRTNPTPYKEKKPREPRFWSYCTTANTYQVYHHDQYYCSCRTREEAEWIVEELRKCDWDKSCVKEIQFDVRGRLYYGND